MNTIDRKLLNLAQTSMPVCATPFKELAKELGKKSVISALREIGKLEARFEKAKEPQTRSEPAAQPAVAKSSKAPAPITPIRGALSTTENNVDADGKFHGTFQQWKAARLAGKIR